MATKYGFKTAISQLISLWVSSICILLVFHLYLLKIEWFSNMFNHGYGMLHGWQCGNISGDLIFTLSVIGGLCLYIPSTIFCALDYYCEQHGVLHKYKVCIPGTTYDKISWDKYVMAINLVRINSMISFFIIPFIILPVMEYRGNCDTFSMITFDKNHKVKYMDILFYLLKIPCFGIIADILFYCTHRSMHEINYCYQKFHKIHHRFNNTFGIVASASHPFEHIFVNLFTVYGTPIILNMNCLSVYIYLWIASIATTLGHSGYDNPSLFAWRKYIGNPHDFHHLYINCEYGSGFNEIMDTIFKTRIQDIFPKRWKAIQSNL